MLNQEQWGRVGSGVGLVDGASEGAVVVGEAVGGAVKASHLWLSWSQLGTVN